MVSVPACCTTGFDSRLAVDSVDVNLLPRARDSAISRRQDTQHRKRLTKEKL